MSTGESVTVRLLGRGDEALIHAAADLFDDTPLPDQTQAFLASERDFIWVAFLGEEAVGFVSATVLIHPDKKPHIFVNELGVDDDHRRKGIGSKLMAEAVGFARSKKMIPLWLAAEGDDDLANSFYRSLSEPTERGSRVYEWEN